MTRSEFLYQFDILYNNITSNQAPGLNGYERSVFLTKAQNEVLKNYFNPKSNRLQEGVEQSPKRHIDFSTIIVTFYPSVVSNTRVTIPFNEAIAILSETVKEDGVPKVVIPITHDEYQRLLSKPYPYPLKKQIWRVMNGYSLGESGSVVQNDTLISHNGYLSAYKVTYVRYPNPIIVGDIEEYQIGNNEVLTVGGYPKYNEEEERWIFPDIEVPVELHEEILQRAVELAKIAWQGDLNSSLAGGQRSE